MEGLTKNCFMGGGGRRSPFPAPALSGGSWGYKISDGRTCTQNGNETHPKWRTQHGTDMDPKLVVFVFKSKTPRVHSSCIAAQASRTGLCPLCIETPTALHPMLRVMVSRHVVLYGCGGCRVRRGNPRTVSTFLASGFAVYPILPCLIYLYIYVPYFGDLNPISFFPENRKTVNPLDQHLDLGFGIPKREAPKKTRRLCR